MVTIVARDLSVTLGRRQVLDGVSATLGSGALVGVIGPNGAGKSTLLRALLGLVPAGGSIEIDGVPSAALDFRERARRIAYLPQGQQVHWPLDAARLVALGRLPHLAPMSRIGAEDAGAVKRAMARADVADLAHRDVTTLSGGERARVLIARALAVEAPALLVDEPLAALDPGHQLDVMALLKDEAAAGGLVVAVLHDLTLAARYCDRLLLLHEGRLVADGAPAEVLTAERLAAVYGIRARIEAEAGGLTVVPTGRVIDPAGPLP